MKTIWQFPLTISKAQQVLLPYDSSILDCKPIEQLPYLWVICNPYDLLIVTHSFSVYKDAEDLPENYGRHIASFRISGISLHVFEDELSLLVTNNEVKL